MKKNVVIYSIVGILVVIGVGWYFLFSSQKGGGTLSSSPTSFPIVSSSPYPTVAYSPSFSVVPSPSPSSFYVPTSTLILVGSVQTHNFYTSSSLITSQGDALMEATDTYSLHFVSDQDRFDIFLLAHPLQQVRAVAQADLLTRLGITQAQACTMDISVFVDQSVNMQFSPINYGLSFCPSGKPLSD